MERVFQQILQMSIYGSIAIMAVLILRRCFWKLPKRITCLFWLIPVFRLLCPLNFNTCFSIMNIARLSGHAEGNIHKVATAVITKTAAGTDIPQMQKTMGAYTSRTLTASGTDYKAVAAYIWLAGMILFLSYLGIKTIGMLKVLKTAKPAPGRNYYISDAFDTSFVLGIVRPRIYMQSGLSKQEEAYILAHERTHIRNLDHITKIIGVLTVCIHWFNPVVWAAFTKMCADLEMRCDEAVIDSMGDNVKRDYCQSIVKHALDRENAQRGLYAAFAGDDHSGKEIKMRVLNIIGYKKISKFVAATVIVFALGVTVVLSTKAQNKEERGQETEAVTKEEPVTQEVAVTPTAAGEAVAAEPEELKKGMAVSVPGNILTDMTEEENLANYGKEEMEIPADVEYSDEGRPYSKTYDYKDTPILNKLGAIFENNGYEICDLDSKYLDKWGNEQTGRELYSFNAYKEDGDESMLVNVYMVSEEYARSSYNEIEEKDGIWVGGPDPDAVDNWYVYRLYDPKTGVMIDATGNTEWDWESLNLFR